MCKDAPDFINHLCYPENYKTISMNSRKKSGIARLLEIAGRKKNLLLLSGVLAVVHALLSLVPYILVYAIIRQLLAPPIQMDIIKTYVQQAAIFAIISYILLYASGMASHVAAFNILYELRRQMADKLGKLPLGFINSNNSGVLKKILSDDIERIENFIAHNIPDFIKGLMLPFITLGYLFYIDWRLAIASCIPVILLAIMLPLMFSRKRAALLTAYHQSLEQMNAITVEYVRAMPVVRIFGHTEESFDRYRNAVNGFNEMVVAWVKRSAPVYGVFIGFATNATLPVLAVGLYLYTKQGVDISVLILFLILGVGYIRPLFAMANLGSQISIINHGVKRLDDVLFVQEQESTGMLPLTNDYNIRFLNVSFAYDQTHNVLHDIDLCIPQGQITALVGPSGSGKSTIGQLIARFWDVQQGRILIGSTDIKEVAVTEMMANVSFVFQDSFMFEQTIYENIRMGMDKTEEAIIAAAKATQCHDFISRLPQGYHTKWGSQGIHLSGGEQQRIQLARAMLKNAPILVLDEATAFSDPENEWLIQQALSKLIKDKTVIIIAHRLSTITNSDQIIVMNNGQILGTGKHDDLLNTCSLYQHMWAAHTRAKAFAI